MQGTNNSVLDILDQSRGYDTALLTTFNFEVNFFEKAILSRLLKNSIRKVSVFVDAKELSKAIREARGTLAGQKYILNPVFMNASFHPKILLLLGEKKARIIIGSGNLKTTGYYINNEIFDCIDYDEAHQNTRGLVVAAIKLIFFASSLTPELDKHLLKEVQQRAYFRGASEASDVQLIENSLVPIIDQIKNQVVGNIRTIRIAAPYYDNELTGLTALHSLFPQAAIELYLQRGRSTFPKEIKMPFQYTIKVFESVLAPEKSNNHFYHGKVFLFKTDNHDYMLYGSSNCTQSALTKSAENKGNVECDLLVKGIAGEFDSFFDCFSLIETSDPESHLLSYVSEEYQNFYFKYGFLEKGLVLHIGYHQPIPKIQFSYNGEVVRWKRSSDELIIEIDADRIEDTIIDLQVCYNNQQEIIRCWYVDLISLEGFRVSVSSTESLADTPDFGEGEKFREDYEKLLKEMGTCKEDYLQTQQSIQPYLTAIMEIGDEPEDPSESEDFIININITDDDYTAYRQYKIMERLRDRVTRRYLQESSWYFSEACSRESPDKSTTLAVTTSSKRQASTEEKRFARFVKSVARSALDDSFIQIVSGEHYIGLLAVIFGVFDKYRNTEGMFQKDYLIETRCALIIKLVNSIHVDKISGELLARALGVILENHRLCEEHDSMEERSGLEKNNRKALLAIEERFHIRNCYRDYFPLDIITNPEVASVSISEACTYFERLFGYHDIEHIQARLRMRSGDMCGVSLQGTTAKVLYISSDPTSFLKPDTILIRDLANYSTNISKLNKIVIDIKNPLPEDANSIVMIQHIIELSYQRWSHSIIRKNGKKQEFTSRFLHY